MIETLKQAQEALEEIKTLTDWPNGRVATKARIGRPAIQRIEDGVGLPEQATMDKLDKELIRVRRVHGGK